ncbi:MAG: DUF1844 domain-containing protein [Planctomycetes bacterium]|nr:DUF1844 domain-containing protein [Planctomycetota bacterium]
MKKEPVEEQPPQDTPADGKVVDEQWKEEALREKAKLQERIEKEYTENKAPSESGDLPPTSFLFFIQNLAAQALIHFGEFENPVTGKVEKNLDAARHTIDTLAMLKDKTSGNLDEQESSFIDALLANLRFKYVESVRSRAGKPDGS